MFGAVAILEFTSPQGAPIIPIHHVLCLFPIFDAMNRKHNQSFPVRDNPFQVIREAPRRVVLFIHNLPFSILPEEPTDIFSSLLESISNAIDIPIFGARFLQPDPANRALKHTTSLVLALDELHFPRFRLIHMAFL